ncbi:M24 family metallopeptidase [Fictibacillus gelatini]|uniref:M24 family metallopeptidase n=1 Tax=Fictibacillus gelatini TaxID=225985 RepID=UPI000424E954|nr:Xaa-Pro peptidase family protein [Fictibacillus gelatini]
MKERIQLFANSLREQNISCAFVTSTANVYYLTGFLCHPHERLLGVMVFPDQEPILVCPGMEAPQARAAGFKDEIIGYSDSENPWDLLGKAVSKRNLRALESIAVEKEQISYERGLNLLSLFPNAELVSAEHQLNAMRIIKSEDEIKAMREAARLADFAVEVGMSTIAKGKTEQEIVAQIEFEVKKKGVSEMSFSTTVLFGEKSARPHGTPGLREIQPGDFVLFDLGVVVDGYCSDITRTFAYQSVSEKQREIYEIVKKAEEAAIAVSKPGTRLGDIDLAARKVIEEAGYGEYFPHRIGHGLGLEVHEFPSMSSNNDEQVKAGMTFTIEPGIYVPDIGGVRIEDDIYVTENGPESLTKFPKELHIIK